jgi:hypothetical protein
VGRPMVVAYQFEDGQEISLMGA